MPVIFEHILKAEEISFDTEIYSNTLRASSGDYDQILEWLSENRVRSKTKKLTVRMDTSLTYDLTNDKYDFDAGPNSEIQI